MCAIIYFKTVLPFLLPHENVARQKNGNFYEISAKKMIKKHYKLIIIHT